MPRFMLCWAAAPAVALEQPTFQLGLFRPGSPVHDAATAQALEVVATGAMPPLLRLVDACRAT